MSSKDQERKALEQIRKIVDDLGEDSYLSFAFKGCFEDAEQNIEDDAAYSWKDRALTYERKLEALAKIHDQTVTESKNQTSNYERMVGELRADLKVCCEQEKLASDRAKTAVEKAESLHDALMDADAERDALKSQIAALNEEVIRLKARLYDYMAQ